jgi:hypothetical protein
MDLFPSLPITKSPKLLWMERHGITTKFIPGSGNVESFWLADYMAPNAAHYQDAGDTEEEALTALALAAGIKLWNEEVA